MTSVLDTLEKRGLIRRLPHATDRRKILVQITPAAQEIVDELLPSLHACERDVISAAFPRIEAVGSNAGCRILPTSSSCSSVLPRSVSSLGT